MVKLEEFKKLHELEPKYTFAEFERYLPHWSDLRIRDSELYQAIKTLSEMAFPSEENEYEKRWRVFYLPLKRRGYFILVPLSILMYNKKYFLSFPQAQVEVDKDGEKDSFSQDLMGQVLALSRILRKDPGIVSKALPYDMRTGRVRGKYVLETLLPFGKKEEIAKLYSDHVRKRLTTNNISLDDYLELTALCYKACFSHKTRGLTAEQMYRKWADGRDCGMLEIRDRKSQKAFGHWLDKESHCGGHPFEIVFSMLDHGIHLFPPCPERPYFTLRVTNYAFTMFFLEMVKKLIRSKAPFRAPELENVLDYLSGESYFSVNTRGRHSSFYSSGDRKLLRRIEWDEPAMVTWK